MDEAENTHHCNLIQSFRYNFYLGPIDFHFYKRGLEHNITLNEIGKHTFRISVYLLGKINTYPRNGSLS